MQIPSDFAVTNKGWVCGIIRIFPATSEIGTEVMRPALNAIIWFQSPFITARAAAAPKLVAKTRSTGLGLPPRWR